MEFNLKIFDFFFGKDLAKTHNLHYYENKLRFGISSSAYADTHAYACSHMLASYILRNANTYNNTPD